MLKTAEPRKGGVGVANNSRAGHGRSKIDGSGMDNIEVDGGKIEVDEVGKKGWKTSKSKKTVISDFFTLGAKLAFSELRQGFLKAPIPYQFDPERHIRIETDVSGYVIGGVLSQLTSDDLDWWHPVAFFSHKMILAETKYKMHDSELLAIVEVFKTRRHYWKGSQHEVFILIDHNNLYWFIDTKSLSSRQVRWAQKLSRYHFQIDFY